MASVEPRSTIHDPVFDETRPLPIRLEQGEIVYFPSCPFELPTHSDMEFLLEQHVAGSAGKNIVYDPLAMQVHHASCTERLASQRLAGILAAHSRQATTWLSGLLNDYSKAWQIGSTTLRPEEEATRRLRFSQREDLLHIDSFPEGASRGRRFLRLFVNLNPAEPRVWATSDGLARLLERYGDAVGLPTPEHASWAWQVRQGMLRPARCSSARDSALPTNSCSAFRQI